MGGRGRQGLAGLAAAIAASGLAVSGAVAQPGGGSGEDGLIDAILATSNQKTPVPQDNEFATAPGLEQAARQPQFTFNALAPLFYNSNPEFRSSGGPQSLEGSPVARLGWASQLLGTPLRVSGVASLEWERFPNANAASVDYFRSSARLQYINPGDDQGFSPFFAYVQRRDDIVSIIIITAPVSFQRSSVVRTVTFPFYPPRFSIPR